MGLFNKSHKDPQTLQLEHELAQAKFEYERQMAMNAAYQQTANQMNSGLYQQSAGGLSRLGGINTVFSSTGAAQAWPHTHQKAASLQPVQYTVELPVHPSAGDQVRVYFDGTRWMEDRIVKQDNKTSKADFSLDELEKAETIIKDMA